MKKYLLEKLECFNDDGFKFEPSVHKYTYDGDAFISVTTFIKQFYKEFDESYWSKRKAEEAGVPQEWILNDWKELADHANEIGNETHEWIEDHFNQNWKPLPTNLEVIDRINKFNVVYAKHLHKLEPLKFEVRIFSKKWKIAGMIDALFIYRGDIFILDWKTNKAFTTDDTVRYKERLLAPFNDFYKSHLSQYSIQLSLYSLILEEWGFKIGGAYLVHFPPDDEAKMFKAVDMREQLKEFLN